MSKKKVERLEHLYGLDEKEIEKRHEEQRNPKIILYCVEHGLHIPSYCKGMCDDELERPCLDGQELKDLDTEVRAAWH